MVVTAVDRCVSVIKPDKWSKINIRGDQMFEVSKNDTNVSKKIYLNVANCVKMGS